MIQGPEWLGERAKVAGGQLTGVKMASVALFGIAEQVYCSHYSAIVQGGRSSRFSSCSGDSGEVS